jgi:predicted GNAT family acetyltransferase
MRLRTHPDTQSFLGNTQTELESNEVANSLMLGICKQLTSHPERFEAAPCLKTLEDDAGLVIAAIMTPPRNLVAYAHRGDLHHASTLLVEDLVREEWRVPGVLGPNEVAKGIAERWTEVTGKGHSLEQRLRVFGLREVKSRVPERGNLRVATETDAALLSRWWFEFAVELFGEADQEKAAHTAAFAINARDVYLWEHGQPASMAMKTRPTRNGISVSAVYTPPDLRGKGYGTACVGELSRMLLAAGWEFCALFADATNVAVNRFYERIGYRPVCEFDEYAFA